MAMAHAPSAFAGNDSDEPNPAKVALNALFGAVETYNKITQIPDADRFMVEKIGRMFDDHSLTGESYARLLAETAETISQPRPFPAVLFAAWVTCAYAIQAIRAADAGAVHVAWALASEASRTFGFAEGAASELIVKFEVAHSAARMKPANDAKRDIRRKSTARVEMWSRRTAYAGMDKGQAAVEMEADGIGLAAGTIAKKLGELFPGKSWEIRRIDQ
jgi:hypothetical protein